jgi:hypothetical protein
MEMAGAVWRIFRICDLRFEDFKVQLYLPQRLGGTKKYTDKGAMPEAGLITSTLALVFSVSVLLIA